MADFLLELLSEEIPARMQEKARADLARLFAAEIAKAGLAAGAIDTYATPRRLALIARALPERTQAVSEEVKGPRVSAPPQALEGFLRKTGLAREALVERDGILFARVETPGRATADVLAEAIPAVIRAFPWPKSMRWGAASLSTESLRWVRPLQGIVALLGDQVVDFEIAGIRAGTATVGHRFHHPGPITIGSAGDYAEKLRACRVILDQEERARIVRAGAAKVAAAAGLALVPDEGLVAENAGLAEWPVPLLGGFDPAFLEVPREVIQLTMRANQKYFALTDAKGNLAPNFVCVANIEASDGGAAIAAGNERVLSARLADARFFWEQDLKVPLAAQAEKLGGIVFHEKLGTLADKVERVAKLARWLVEESVIPAEAGISFPEGNEIPASAGMTNERLADLAERAARLAKADLVTGLVGEFPELQGVIGGHLARAQDAPDEIADAIRDHYKPVGQGDEVPTAPVTVAVSLADKLDTLVSLFAAGEAPTGSRDPYALRRAAIGVISIIVGARLRVGLQRLQAFPRGELLGQISDRLIEQGRIAYKGGELTNPGSIAWHSYPDGSIRLIFRSSDGNFVEVTPDAARKDEILKLADIQQATMSGADAVVNFFADRLKVQQREAGVRHDLIDAVFALGAEDDLVRLLARVKALQSFVETPEGADLLAGYKRAANILKKEGWTGADAGSVSSPMAPAASGWEGRPELSYPPEAEEAALIAALDAAEPKAAAAVEAEDFEGAMAALASLRAPVDAFFDKVTVNDPDPARREARLGLLARMRAAVHRVADFSRIEG